MAALLRPLVLASGSPRRTEILTSLGIDHIVIKSGAEEIRNPSEKPGDYALRLALAKASDVAASLDPSRDNAVVLGADTIVVLGDEVLEKPTDVDDATRMARVLSGKVHEVMTAVALVDRAGLRASKLVTTRVRFRAYSDGVAAGYGASREGLDKAGGYAIQGLGAGLVDGIEGSYTNVVGLPATEVLMLLEAHGVVATWP